MDFTALFREANKNVLCIRTGLHKTIHCSKQQVSLDALTTSTLLTATPNGSVKLWPQETALAKTEKMLFLETSLFGRRDENTVESEQFTWETF